MPFSRGFVRRVTLTGGEDALYELLSGHLAILVFVNAPEEVHDTGLFVVHPAHVALPPHVKVEVGEFLYLHRNIEEGHVSRDLQEKTCLYVH